MTIATSSRSIVADRAAWLEERRNGVGASEAAAALGVSPFESPRELYLRKLGVLPEAEESEAMRWGSMLEPAIAREYERRTGMTVIEQQIFIRSPDTPLFATLDGMTNGGFPVEFKAVGPWSGRELGEEETDQLPEHWLIQGHQQMLLSSTWRMQFAVLVAGQKLRIFTVERDEALVEAIIVGVRAFWGCVERREAPASDARADRRILHLLYPGCEGETELSEDDQELVDAMEEMAEDRRELEEERELVRARLIERLGDHGQGRLPDGRLLLKRVVKVPPKWVEAHERKGSEYVRLWVKKGGLG